MIQFIQERDKNIFKCISKRKKKIEILNKNYEYKNIEFIRKLISEITEKYYHSNILSHVPKIVSLVNGKPFDSKSDDLFNFIQDKFHIRKELDILHK